MVENICQRAFSEIEIHTDGNVYTCCPDYLKSYSIGNIFQVKTFDEIWYSDKAKELRRSILKGNYQYCNTNICNKKIMQENVELSENPPYPTLVRFSYDMQCNLKCMICRDKLLFNDEQKIKFYDSLLDSILIPVLKNAKIMSITSAGEITASLHSQKLLKKSASVYPDLRFEILTNGLLFDEEFCNNMGITDRIDQIVISMHAATKKTYENIMIGSNFEKVQKNLNWVIAKKNEGKIKNVCLIFVVSSLNYKEIPDFIRFSKNNNISVSVWEYRNHNRTDMDKNFKKYALWLPTHPLYNDFVKVINAAKQEFGNYCQMPPLFNNLKPVGFIQNLKNKLSFLKGNFR